RVFVIPVIEIAVYAGKVRVIENVEELAAKFHVQAVPQSEGLDEGKVQVDEVRPANDVPSHVAELSRLRRRNGPAVARIAAVVVELRNHAAAIHAQNGTGLIVRAPQIARVEVPEHRPAGLPV